MIVIETTVWVDYFGGRITPHTDWLDANIRNPTLALTDLILTEILQGIRDRKEFESTRDELLNFTVLTGDQIKLAVASAGYYRQLRSKGITVRKTIAALIAAVCIEGGHSILHNDRDFDPYEKHFGLKVLRP